MHNLKMTDWKITDKFARNRRVWKIQDWKMMDEQTVSKLRTKLRGLENDGLGNDGQRGRFHNHVADRDDVASAASVADVAGPLCCCCCSSTLTPSVSSSSLTCSMENRCCIPRGCGLYRAEAVFRVCSSIIARSCHSEDSSFSIICVFHCRFSGAASLP